MGASIPDSFRPHWFARRELAVMIFGKGFPRWMRTQYHGEGWNKRAVCCATEDERRREAERWRGASHRGHRQGQAEDEEARDVQGPHVERRLHADGVCRSHPGAVFQQEPRRGDAYHV